MSIIQVEDVSMRFNLAQEKTETLKEYTVKLLKHQLFFNEFYALRDISFKIEPGESPQRQRQEHDAEIDCGRHVPHDGQRDRQRRDRAPDRAGRGL